MTTNREIALMLHKLNERADRLEGEISEDQFSLSYRIIDERSDSSDAVSTEELTTTTLSWNNTSEGRWNTDTWG